MVVVIVAVAEDYLQQLGYKGERVSSATCCMLHATRDQSTIHMSTGILGAACPGIRLTCPHDVHQYYFIF